MAWVRQEAAPTVAMADEHGVVWQARHCIWEHAKCGCRCRLCWDKQVHGLDLLRPHFSLTGHGDKYHWYLQQGGGSLQHPFASRAEHHRRRPPMTNHHRRYLLPKPPPPSPVEGECRQNRHCSFCLTCLTLTPMLVSTPLPPPPLLEINAHDGMI